MNQIAAPCSRIGTHGSLRARFADGSDAVNVNRTDPARRMFQRVKALLIAGIISAIFAFIPAIRIQIN